MVSSVGRSSRLSLLVAILCIAISIARAADIDGICKKTIDPPLCLQLLNSIPGVAGLDLITLGKTTFNNAIANASATQNLIKSVLSKTTDPQLKKNLDNCSSFVGETIGSLQEGLALFGAANYFSASLDAADAQTNVENCISAIGSGSSVPSVSTNIRDVDVYCNVNLAISASLVKTVF